jgi:hypothetical protein
MILVTLSYIVYRVVECEAFFIPNVNVFARFEVLTAVMVKIQVFWHVTSCRLVSVTDVSKESSVCTFRVNQYQNILKRLGLLDPEDGGTTSLRNIGNCLPVGAV